VSSRVFGQAFREVSPLIPEDTVTTAFEEVDDGRGRVSGGASMGFRAGLAGAHDCFVHAADRASAIRVGDAGGAPTPPAGAAGVNSRSCLR
jgi:hypothetical protein